MDLLQPEQWPVVAEAGLVCSMGYPTARRDFLTTGFNDPANHAMLLRELEATLPRAAAAGVPNVIAMFGNRKGRADDLGRDACIEGLNRIKGLAEELGRDHLHGAAQQPGGPPRLHGRPVGLRGVGGLGGRTRRGSSCSTTSTTCRSWKATSSGPSRPTPHGSGISIPAACPGRHEIDGTQELNYHAICEAIKGTGYQGYVAHEFEPTRPPMESLRQAYEICLV